MRRVIAGTALAVLMLCTTAWSGTYINRIPLADVIPPPPARGSSFEQAEIAEILKLQASVSSVAAAQAKRDNDIES